MIRYCLSAVLLVACSSIGTKSEPTFAPLPDPVPVIVLPEIEVRSVRIPGKPKSFKRAARPQCDEEFDDKREEFMTKLECVKKLTEKGGA